MATSGVCIRLSRSDVGLVCLACRPQNMRHMPVSGTSGRMVAVVVAEHRVVQVSPHFVHLQEVKQLHPVYFAGLACILADRAEKIARVA